MTLSEKARLFATAAHAAIDQRRKYTDEPYINHPKRVVTLVSLVTQDEHVLSAAWLHDVVEDTKITLDEIEKHFGHTVRDLVDDLTDISKPSDGNREFRKQIDLVHTKQASYWAKTIKLADLIDNAKDIIQHDKQFAKVYLQEKERLLSALEDAHPYMLALATTTHLEAVLKLKE